MNASPLLAAIIAAVQLGLCWKADATMAGKLYLTDGATPRLFAIEDSSVVLDVTMPTGASALAIRATIRTLGRSNGIAGSEYSLSGTVTGTTPSHNIGGSLFLDGTTDGVFNYSVDYANHRVYRFNLDWSSPQILFPTNPASQHAGITFDPTSNELWITGIGGNALNRLERYTLDGVLVFAIDVGIRSNVLAFDHVDQTLWLHESGTGNLKQFSLEGLFLSSISVPALAGKSIDGAEFAIPEPSVSVLLAAGLIALSRRRPPASDL